MDGIYLNRTVVSTPAGEACVWIPATASPLAGLQGRRGAPRLCQRGVHAAGGV